jgi:uncharacterized FlgJ-related protein
MTQYYPKLFDLKYKDKWLNITIPVRIKKFIIQHHKCDKCKFETRLGTFKFYFNNNNVNTDQCPSCKDGVVSLKPKEMYKIYTDMRKPIINIKYLLNRFTPFSFRRRVGKYIDLNAVSDNDLKSIYIKLSCWLKKEDLYKVNYKIYDITEQKLQEDLDDYTSRRVAKVI